MTGPRCRRWPVLLVALLGLGGATVAAYRRRALDRAEQDFRERYDRP